MEYSDIYDPTHEIDFHVEWTLISGRYTANEIQRMINDNGVIAMVKTVNEHFRLITGHAALQLVWVGNGKAVIQA